jgi:hypothetical protein
MPLILLPLALVLTVAAQAPACPRPTAPDEAAARRIAEREISSRPRTGVRWRTLNVIPDRRRPGQWLAYEGPAPGAPLTRGGGGAAMNIDRCTGAVSNFHYQR